MNKIVGIVGSGMIGTNPFDKKLWSGSGYSFFQECIKQDILQAAYGVEIDKWKYYYLLLKNFHYNKRIWRSKFNLDVDYYDELTENMKDLLTEEDKQCVLLQIGGHYNSSKIFPNSICCSYHDGNVYELMNSPYFDRRLLKSARKAFSYEKEVYSSLTYIFTMSEYLRQSFINNFDVQRNKVVCINAGINIPEPYLNVDKNYDEINILFVGIDFYRKGGDLLVTAFNNIKQKYTNVNLIIVGPKQIPQIVKNNPSKINFLGHLNKSDESDLYSLINIYEHSHLGILPSRYEPFGIVVPEMMRYGIPVITPNNWAFPEMVIPNKTGMLYFSITESKIIEELTELLDFYLSNIDKIKEHSKNAIQLSKKYTWQNVVNNIKLCLKF